MRQRKCIFYIFNKNKNHKIIPSKNTFNLSYHRCSLYKNNKPISWYLERKNKTAHIFCSCQKWLTPTDSLAILCLIYRQGALFISSYNLLKGPSMMYYRNIWRLTCSFWLAPHGASARIRCWTNVGFTRDRISGGIKWSDVLW